MYESSNLGHAENFKSQSPRVTCEPTASWDRARHLINLPVAEAEVAAARYMTRQRALWQRDLRTEHPQHRAFQLANVQKVCMYTAQVDPLEQQLQRWATLTHMTKQQVAELYYWYVSSDNKQAL